MEKEISQQWGGSLNFGHITLSVPYIYTTKAKRDVKVKDNEYKQITEIVKNSGMTEFFAREMKVDSQVKVEKRYKGFY